MKNVIFLSILLFSMSGCVNLTNPTPDIVKPDEISFDGNEQNSGVLYQITQGGFIITEGAKDRYNALIKLYGAKCTPPVCENFGLTPVYIATDEAIETFAKLNLWHKNQDILKDMPMHEVSKEKTFKKWYQFWK